MLCGLAQPRRTGIIKQFTQWGAMLTTTTTETEIDMDHTIYCPKNKEDKYEYKSMKFECD